MGTKKTTQKKIVLGNVAGWWCRLIPTMFVPDSIGVLPKTRTPGLFWGENIYKLKPSKNDASLTSYLLLARTRPATP